MLQAPLVCLLAVLVHAGEKKNTGQGGSLESTVLNQGYLQNPQDTTSNIAPESPALAIQRETAKILDTTFGAGAQIIHDAQHQMTNGVPNNAPLPLTRAP